MQQRGIISFGAYVPRRRLARRTICSANSWANPGLAATAHGHKAICSHDEDSLTMAVAAARYALAERPEDNAPDMLVFASTTMPFADRQNAGVIAEAASLSENTCTADMGGSLKAGVGALRMALERPGETLVVAADKRLTRPGGPQELRIGDAAAAIVVGEGDPLAEFVARRAVSVDFTDHYRSSDAQFDYQLEERWARDAGLLHIVPGPIRGLIEDAGIGGENIAHFVAAGLGNRNARTIAKHCGIPEGAVTPDLHAECGDTGTAHPLLLLTKALQSAAPGEFILLLGYGQGAEALLFRATDTIGRASGMTGADAMLADGVEDGNYLRFLSFNGHVSMDWGMRAERDNRTAQSAFFRHRDTVTGCIGGRCTACGTPQFPKSRVCVNPGCRATDSQVSEPFADKPASVKSFTEDWLALSFNPPLMYGNVRFAGGGVAMLEFSDFEPSELAVGAPLAMQFRLKDVDDRRGFRRYCWKAVPPRELSTHTTADKEMEGASHG
ncbi:3-oxoacyl-[acyl-carrier-protein] synthase III C-terminal domain-containing protein [Parasphingopyxis marina]|uniref:3-oxoacyl-ACP synthase n=1 Tax=Parasphingopyxis marina TaxID=2761622 RepID=A0A842I488_9SPHN|nr:3-oxoacyl-[acyl-carrier-protein] synthase III C-terminal domain-containing protein [Parasphingopyxis marina]MBC2778984.1 3-oxoacyl-ACP synthase [Parasphingopyxis marina]